jgi:hypothetical protein
MLGRVLALGLLFRNLETVARPAESRLGLFSITTARIRLGLQHHAMELTTSVPSRAKYSARNELSRAPAPSRSQVSHLEQDFLLSSRVGLIARQSRLSLFVSTAGRD